MPSRTRIGNIYSNKFPELSGYEGVAGPPFCWNANWNFETEQCIHPKFSFTFFQAAIKRHCQGTKCEKLLTLLSQKPVKQDCIGTYCRRTLIAGYTADTYEIYHAESDFFIMRTKFCHLRSLSIGQDREHSPQNRFHI